MSKKIDSYIVFASLSKNIILGEENIKLLARHKIYVLILANDIGASQKKKYLDKASYYHCPVHYYRSKDELASLLHKGSVSCIGIKDTKLAKAIIKEMEVN